MIFPSFRKLYVMLAPVLAVAHVTSTLVPVAIVASEGDTDIVGVLGITEINGGKPKYSAI